MTTPQQPIHPPADAPKEPVLNRTGVVLLSQGVAYVAATLGFSLDPVVTGIVVGLAGPAVLGLLARAAAWSPRSVAELIDDLTKKVTEQPPAGLGGPAGFSSSPNANPGDSEVTTSLRYPDNTNPGSTL